MNVAAVQCAGWIRRRSAGKGVGRTRSDRDVTDSLDEQGFGEREQEGTKCAKKREGYPNGYAVQSPDHRMVDDQESREWA